VNIQIRLNWGPRFVYGALVLLSILAVEIGYYLEKGMRFGSRTLENAALGHLIGEIGIAGLIGFVLSLTFERLSAKEFKELAERERDTIKTDVFFYVYGYGLPQQIREMINGQVLKIPYIRKNMEAKYTLEVFSHETTNTKYVRARRDLSYEIENLTKRHQPFPFNAATDLPPILELDKEAKFMSIRIEDCVKPFEANETQLREMQVDEGHERYVRHDIEILPDKTTKVFVETQTVKHLDGGRLYLILSNHTCDLTIRVRNLARDLEVIATDYTQEDKILKGTGGHDPEAGTYTWKIQRPILAYQGVYVSWNAKESSPK
jgi:hypothetical protein